MTELEPRLPVIYILLKYRSVTFMMYIYGKSPGKKKRVTDKNKDKNP